MPAERQFVGLDAYQKAIESDIDMVLLCTPPGFRPMQFEAAVKAGRHVFMEKPLATDAPGLRRIVAANEEAKKKKLAVAVGHHLRHEVKHREIIQRIHDGAIGDLQYMRIYFNTGAIWVRPRRPGQTEMQHQVSNWYHFTWLSGDHIAEQHVHDIDIGNWIAKGHPVEAQGTGGRQVCIGPNVGEIFDHHAIDFTYPHGVKMFSYCRQIPGCWGSFSEHAHGTKGSASIEGRDIVKEIRLLGKLICELYAKDGGHLLGQGRIDFKQVRKALDDIQYSGWIQLEAAAPNGLIVDYTANLQYLKGIFNRGL